MDGKHAAFRVTNCNKIDVPKCVTRNAGNRLPVVDKMTSVIGRQARNGKSQGACTRSQSIAVHYEVLLQVLLL